MQREGQIAWVRAVWEGVISDVVEAARAAVVGGHCSKGALES